MLVTSSADDRDDHELSDEDADQKRDTVQRRNDISRGPRLPLGS